MDACISATISVSNAVNSDNDVRGARKTSSQYPNTGLSTRHCISVTRLITVVIVNNSNILLQLQGRAEQRFATVSSNHGANICELSLSSTNRVSRCKWSSAFACTQNRAYHSNTVIPQSYNGLKWETTEQACTNGHYMHKVVTFGVIIMRVYCNK